MKNFGQEKISLTNFWDSIGPKAAQVAGAGSTPLLVIDLDGTLIDYTLRTRMIFLQAVDTLHLPGTIAESVKQIKPGQYDYDPKTTLIGAGIDDDDTLNRLLDFWDKYYFSNYYLHYDKPMPGAYDFIQNIAALKMGIVYLTGRDYRNMAAGTRAWLQKNHFLNSSDPGRSVLMKDNLSLTNFEAKANNREKIAGLGQPILIVDNEPIDLQTMLEHFPEAVPVLADTPNSGKPAKLPADILTIRDFLELNSLYKKA